MWQPWYSLETLKFVFSIFSEYQGCHPDGLSVSVYGGLIIYILTLAALNVCKTHFLTWVLSKWTKTPNTCDFTENGQYICNSYVVWCMVTTYKQTYLFPNCVFCCRPGISYSYNSFCGHISADFNGRFLTGCCCVKTNSIAKSSRLN